MARLHFRFSYCELRSERNPNIRSAKARDVAYGIAISTGPSTSRSAGMDHTEDQKLRNGIEKNRDQNKVAY
jgi:hypothetical protein